MRYFLTVDLSLQERKITLAITKMYKPVGLSLYVPFSNRKRKHFKRTTRTM